MKNFIKLIVNDYKQENYTIMQWIVSAVFAVMLIIACGIAEWLNGKCFGF